MILVLTERELQKYKDPQEGGILRAFAEGRTCAKPERVVRQARSSVRAAC